MTDMVNLAQENIMPKSITYCQVENCETRCAGNGYCLRHYKQVKRHGRVISTSYERRYAVIDGNIAKIPLGIDAKDGYAIVDKEYAYLDKYNWHLSSAGYVYSHDRTERRILHRIVTGCSSKMVVDHKDHDLLNNTLDNLRVCKQKDNMKNIKTPKDNTSGYKGVCWDKSKNKWMVRLGAKFVGYFDDKLEAARAYNQRAIEIYGEYANLNKIKENI